MKIEQKFLTMKIEEEKSDSLDDRVNSTANKEKGKFMSWEKRERERGRNSPITGGGSGDHQV